MMAKRIVKPEEVEREIVRLERSTYVKLARVYEAVEQKRREYLRELQDMEAKGIELAAAGVTISYLEELLGADAFL